MKTILITGGNKGIGLEVAKQLLELNHRIILGSRNIENGKKALTKLGSRDNLTLLQLDVSDEKSISLAADKIGELGFNLDVIVNNAAILTDKEKIDKMSVNLFMETFKTNTLGPIIVIQHFLRYLNNNGRIINVSSGLGSLSDMGDYSPAYSISKTALNAVTKQFASVLSNKKISVNSVCPGWVRTDMGGANATRSVKKGAESIVWLANEAPQKITGKFIRDKKVIDW